MTVTTHGHAKINLFLDVESLRNDGYHNIVSIMQAVSLHDDITVTYTPSAEKTIEVFCDSASIPCDKSNLVYKAADIYPICGSISIRIEKRIPVSAGLAGGSADAAATLTALNSLCENKLSIDELCLLGSRLGADVPFCIKSGACLVKGIGERLEDIPVMPNFPIVIAKKGDGMSTPAAYRALDDKYNKFVDYTVNNGSLDILFNDSIRSDAKAYCKGLFNIFESVVEAQRPCVTELKGIMLQNGAAGSMMSGSGTSVFGIFENEADASRALDALLLCGADAHLCYPI